MGHRAMYHRLVELVLEDVLLDGKSLFEIFNTELAHVHDGPNIELIDPMRHFIHA